MEVSGLFAKSSYATHSVEEVVTIGSKQFAQYTGGVQTVKKIFVDKDRYKEWRTAVIQFLTDSELQRFIGEQYFGGAGNCPGEY